MVMNAEMCPREIGKRSFREMIFMRKLSAQWAVYFSLCENKNLASNALYYKSQPRKIKACKRKTTGEF